VWLSKAFVLQRQWYMAAAAATIVQEVWTVYDTHMHEFIDDIARLLTWLCS